MDTLQCAIVLAKLDRFNWEIEQRIAIGHRYNQLLADAGVKYVQLRPDRSSVFAQYTILINNRKMVQEHLNVEGIPTSVHYPVPLNEQPAYKHLCCPDCTPVAHKLSQQVMSLPMGPDITSDQQQKIIKHLMLAINDN
jgi:UDP-2-acetamido-2-deoxy-ribo-hexuluronate aminotransferase